MLRILALGVCLWTLIQLYRVLFRLVSDQWKLEAGFLPLLTVILALATLGFGTGIQLGILSLRATVAILLHGFLAISLGQMVRALSDRA